MKKILIGLCVLISVNVFGQVPGYTKINARYNWTAGIFDTSLHVPRYNGTPSGLRVGAYIADGAVAVDTLNHRWYFYSGGAWVRGANYSEIGSTYTFPYSVVAPGNAVQLENDTIPFANGVYTFNSAGRRTWQTKANFLTGYATQTELDDSSAAIRADFPAGGGTSLTYSANPSAWVTQKSVNNPVINSDMYTPNPVTEHTQYAPSPIIASDGNVWVYVKGDATQGISVYKSTDRGETFTFQDTVIMPTPGTYYSSNATIPGAVADSANNLIHLYFQAMPTGTTPNVFSVGKSTAPFTDPTNVTVASTPLITSADFATQMGMAFQPGYLNITSVVKTDSIYFFGTFWDGNADNPTGDFKIFMGSSINYDTIRNCRVILSPTAPYDLVRSPTVFSDNGLYKMIYTNGYIDNDSLTDLVSAYSSDLKTWTHYPGVLLSVGPAGSWEEKRVYMAQVLKKSTGTFADPYFFPNENYGYPQNDNYTDAIKYYYSGSNFDAPPYRDYTGLGYLYPQRSRDDFFIAENDTNVSVINRNTTHVINIPNATDSTTGKLKSSDWSLFNSKAAGSGSANYIQNRSIGLTPQASSSFTISDSAYIGKTLSVGSTGALYAFNVNANAGTGNYAGMQITNSANFGKDFYWQIATSGEIGHGATGTSGSYTLGSFAGGMLWKSAYWRWQEAQSPFNYLFEIDGAASASAINMVPFGGKVAIGGYTKDSTLTNNGSLHQVGNAKFDAKIHAPNLATGNGTKAVRWDATNGFVLADTTSGSGGSGGDSVVSFQKNAGRDSIILTMYDGRRFAAKDSIGAGGSASPGGSDTYVQFNDASSFGGDAGMTYDKTLNKLLVAGTATNPSSWSNFNSGNLASTTDVNPGVTVYNAGSPNVYGMNLGYFGGYGLNFMTANSTSFFWTRGVGNVHAGFTRAMTLNASDQLSVAGGLYIGSATTAPTSTLHSGGSFATAYTATATGITLSASHSVVNVTATGQTITLPTAASITGRQYTIKLTASGSATVATTSSQTIDGSTTYSLSAQYKYVTVVSDGTNWIITANN